MNNFNQLIKYINNQQNQINPILLFNKFITNNELGNNKKNLLEKIKNISISSYKILVDSIINHLEDFGFNVIYNNTLVTFSPLICGLGATHVLETSITLHHIWGVPYIPASSLKGVCRQVAFWKLAENRRNDIDNFQKIFYGNLNDSDEDVLVYQLLFGAQDFKGLLLFLDVYPDFSDENSRKPFKLDIMNPHYSSYYSDDSGQTVPGDWENPIPIFFLTVKPGVKFKFVILFDNYRWGKVTNEGILITKENKKEKLQFSDSIKDKLNKLIKNNSFFEEILKDALATYGVGSKTRLGYGSFNVINNQGGR